MTMQERIATARSMVARFQKDTGVPCSLQELTYYPNKRLYSPPYATVEAGVPVSIASLASLQDPRINTVIERFNISVEKYRQLTMPNTPERAERFNPSTAGPDQHIVKEPVGPTSDRYIVVEAMSPDETTPLEIILHCQKV